MHARQTVVFQNTLENLLVLNKFFGTPASIGLFLLKQHFEMDPWVSVQDVAKLTDLSEDTVRRRLNDLVKVGRVEVRNSHERGGRRRYRVSRKTAETVLRRMVWDHTVIGAVPVIPQFTVADCD